MDSRALNPGGKFTGTGPGLMIRTLQTLSGRSGAAPCGMDMYNMETVSGGQQ